MEKRKEALITGGSSGIGRGIVYCLAEAGHDVAFSYDSQRGRAEHVQVIVDILTGQAMSEALDDPEYSFYSCTQS